VESIPASERLARTCCCIGLLVLCTLSSNIVAVSQYGAVMTSIGTLGLSPDDLFLGAHGIAFLHDGRMLVTDKLEYNIKCFDRNRRLAVSVGKRGARDGEFRGPGPIAASDTVVAVADFASRRVQLFSSSLKPRISFTTDTPVFDICFDAAGGLWIGKLPGSGGATLVRYDRSGMPSMSIVLKHLSTDLFDNIFAMAPSGTNEIIIAYMTHNAVEIWNTSGRFVREFHVSGIHPRADRKTIPTGWFSDDVFVPENNVFQDVAVDRHGRIYLLADAYTEHPRRDVYVVSPEGGIVSRLILGGASQGIVIDSHSRLFSIEGERTLIRVYNLGDQP
jgi:hypothetical protein